MRARAGAGTWPARRRAPRSRATPASATRGAGRGAGGPPGPSDCFHRQRKDIFYQAPLYFSSPTSFGLGKLSCKWKTTFSTKCCMLLCSGPRTNTIQSWVKPTVGFSPPGRAVPQPPASPARHTAGRGGYSREQQEGDRSTLEHCAHYFSPSS